MAAATSSGMTRILPIVLSSLLMALAACELEWTEGPDDELYISADEGGMPYRGVNLASADFGEGNLPGVHGTDYIYPDPAYASGYNSATYYLGKHMTVFRLPFRWERLQRSMYAGFDAAELTRLETTVGNLTSRGAAVLLDPHNYARYYGNLVGSGAVPNAAFADFWSRLAGRFKNNPKVIFGLVNEPHDMPTEQWVSAANAAIAAIRATGATNLILVPGNSWTGAHSWTQNWYGTANSVAMLNISDPGNNYAFEVHQYLDANSSGTDSACVSATIGAERMQAFTGWLRSNGKKGFLGELGGGTSATCLAAVDGMLDHLEANADLYLGWTWWAGGPWWGDSWYSLEPSGSADRPQMDALEPHLTAVTDPPPLPPPAPSTTYEAETMYHSTGGAVSGGWNIWSNGYIQTSHAFTAGVSTITVHARGTPAGGVWPRMRVSVGGVDIGQVTVAASAWTAYAFSPSLDAGTRTIRVAFDNDAIIAGEDRNLLVDKVVVSGGSTTCTSRTYEAEGSDVYRSCGGAVSGGWNLWSDMSAGCYLETAANHDFASAAGKLTVYARGQAAAGTWPRMRAYVGGTEVGSASVGNATGWAPYSFTFTTATGGKKVRITWDNDYLGNGEDRNLLIDKFVVGCP